METQEAIALETTQELRLAAAERSGQDETSIGQIQLELRKLRAEGILVDVDIRGLTMFNRQATLAELGIPADSVRGQKIRPGQRDLIPRDTIRKLRSLAERMRNTLRTYGQQVTGFAPYQYLYWKAYDEFTLVWDKLNQEWAVHKTHILDNLDDWKTAYIADYEKQAHEAWDALMAANGQTRSQTALIIHTRQGRPLTFEDREAFTQWILGRAEPLFPTAGHIQSGLTADYKTAIMISQADIAAEQARAEQHQAEIDEARARQEKARQRKRVAASQADLKMQAILETEREHARAQLQAIGSPFRELFDNLRAQMYASAKEVAGSIDRCGFLNPQVQRKIENMVHTFSILNATEDADLEKLLETARDAAKATPCQTGRAGKVTPVDAVALNGLRSSLNAILDATVQSAHEVARRTTAAEDLAALEI